MTTAAPPQPLTIADSDRRSSPPTARVVEVFSAIQGEGMIVGTRQIFVRFGGCDLRCRFCDSDQTWTAPKSCQIEQTPGDRDFLTEPNPVTIDRLLAWVLQLHRPGLHDSVSLTGGEPLLHADFLAQFLPRLRAAAPELPLYLETGGHRPDRLGDVLPHLDWIGMDLKLPSASGEQHWQAHQDFLAACVAAGRRIFVKAITTRDTTEADLVQAAELVAAIAPATAFILQPVSTLPAPILPDQTPPLPPTPAQVLAWQERLKQILPEVRVIPQTHKAIGQR